MFFEVPFVAMAHRGGATCAANLGRENTVHAFTTARDMGYTFVETDVHATSDGVLLAFHDDRLDRVTSGTGLIHELPWARIREHRIGGLDPIPTLDEVLETFPDLGFNIDIKAWPAIDPLIETINRHRAHRRVNVASFSGTRLAVFRQRSRNRVTTSLAPGAIALHRLAPALAPRFPARGVALQVPSHHTVGGRRFRVVTPQLIRSAHASGAVVHVWTIDDPHEMAELIDLGVDGLISDRIDTLKAVLQSRGLWYGRD